MAWVLPGWRGGLGRRRRLDRGLIAETSALAEELVAETFRLAPRELAALQYELVHAGEGPLRLPEFALAGLVRAENGATLPRQRRSFYLLCLAEERLAALAGRDSLRALLLYIFTHELVHMVRFLRFAAGFWMPPEERWREEREVHRLARTVLQGLPLRGVGEVILRFDQLYEASGR